MSGVLLVEPGKTGHRPVILRYVCKVLASRNVRYAIETSPEATRNPEAVQNAAARCHCELIHLLTFDNVFRQWAGRPGARAIPVVATYYLFSNFSHPLRGLIADAMLKRSGVSKLLVSDEYLERRRLPGWRRKRLMYLPDPWDPDEFTVTPQKSAREALRLPPYGPIVLMFGELSRRKGVDTMLEALAMLPPSARVQGLFAGRMCPEVRKSFEPLIIELRARGRLLWREGFVDEEDVAAYFCAADAVACPYPAYFSVSSNTATRAAAAGRPIIVSRHGILGRIAMEKRIGLTFRSGDVVGLADCMIQIEQTVGTRFLAEMGERARPLAAKRTLEHYGNALISAYSSVLPTGAIADAEEKAASIAC
jgi:glycosyltransferase involved in cell wall biosynthesis